MKKIIYGVCGIGNGHTFRQLPILEELKAQGNQIAVLGYDSSLKVLSHHFAEDANVKVIEVAVPYYPALENGRGLDFSRSSQLALGMDHVAINTNAMAEASVFLDGELDLCISDYEPVSAQFAYAYDAPVVTIDQQSKYLLEGFKEINGYRCQDEAMRLRMFFPLAAKRIAMSFFKVAGPNPLGVALYPPLLREKILNSTPSEMVSREIVVYLTGQAGYNQPLKEIDGILRRVPDVLFTVFTSIGIEKTAPSDSENVKWRSHGDSGFDDSLLRAMGVICTAGHTLLSECMYLGKAVYALPLSLYEQQMNAHCISEHGFGISRNGIEYTALREFVKNIALYEKNITENKNRVLLLPNTRTKEDIIELILDETR